MWKPGFIKSGHNYTFLCTISFLNTVRALGENSWSIISKLQVVEVKELNVCGSLLVSSNLITSCIIIIFYIVTPARKNSSSRLCGVKTTNQIKLIQLA